MSFTSKLTTTSCGIINKRISFINETNSDNTKLKFLIQQNLLGLNYDNSSFITSQIKFLFLRESNENRRLAKDLQ